MGIFTPLVEPAVFRTVLSRGSRVGGDGVQICALERDSDGLRLGLAVKAPDAVTRNRIKRRLRAALQEATRDSARRADVVIRARPPADRIAFQELVTILKSAVGGVG